MAAAWAKFNVTDSPWRRAHKAHVDVWRNLLSFLMCREEGSEPRSCKEDRLFGFSWQFRKCSTVLFRAQPCLALRHQNRFTAKKNYGHIRQFACNGSFSAAINSRMPPHCKGRIQAVQPCHTSRYTSEQLNFRFYAQ